ncbi:B12-binding domain-containing radical SAM protein [Thermodesulfobacteriota bacterium]
MRFLLINPFYPISETPSPPLGLAYLAAALETAGVEVKVLDFVVFPYSKKIIESVLKEFSPDFVGVTAVTMTFDNAVRIIRDTKRIDPDILTVMGGPHVTFCAPDVLKSCPEIDVVVVGEGEETIVDLVRTAKGTSGWHTVKGLVFRNGAAIITTPKRELIGNIDDLAEPARQLLPLGRYRALGMPVSMTTSRGCPFKCIFCIGRKMGGQTVRYRNPQKVVDELESLSILNFNQINIADDLFTANKKHCFAICNELIKRGVKVAWSAFARVDTLSKDLLKLMKEAGCHTLGFGVESADAGILEHINKGITIGQVIQAIDACLETGITPQASFILGLPGETPETLKETVRFGEELKKMGVLHGYHLLAPFPGTEVRENSDAYGIKIISHDWSEYHANRAIVETSTVNQKMLNDVVIAWEREFDEYLGEIKRRMETGEATEEEAWQLKRLEYTVAIYDLMMGQLIEQKGHVPVGENSWSDIEALQRLSGELSESTSYTAAQLFDALKFALEQGYIRQRADTVKNQWEWVDFL